jgi:hypothetical protein
MTGSAGRQEMRSILAVCGFAALVAAMVGCGKRAAGEPAVLDYDHMILLDAEALAEGGIGSSYRKDIAPVLKQYVATPAGISEELGTEAGSYKVTSQGQTYVIYSPGMDLEQGQSWGNATFALFDIVDRQLQGSSVRFYAVNGGNDLGGIFLTQETYNRAVGDLRRKRDWPYLPEAAPPWYGQPHEN